MAYTGYLASDPRSPEVMLLTRGQAIARPCHPRASKGLTQGDVNRDGHAKR